MLKEGYDHNSALHFWGQPIVCCGLEGALRGVMVLFEAPIAHLLGTG